MSRPRSTCSRSTWRCAEPAAIVTLGNELVPAKTHTAPLGDPLAAEPPTHRIARNAPTPSPRRSLRARLAWAAVPTLIAVAVAALAVFVVRTRAAEPPEG